MPAFARYIGIYYSEVQTPPASLPGLRIYGGDKGGPLAVEIAPPPSARKYRTRRGIAECLVERLAGETPTLVGIDHGFSFPLRYFEAHALKPDWDILLEAFQRHWPTDKDQAFADFVGDGIAGNEASHTSNSRWRRLTEERTGHATWILTAGHAGAASAAR
jgi:hypothetical protein